MLRSSKSLVSRVGKTSAALQQSVRQEHEYKEKIKTQYKTEVFQNPYIKRHQEKRAAVSEDHYKQTTGLTGLYINEHPHRDLEKLYNRILMVLKKMPSDYAYRESTEKIVKERLDLVHTIPEIPKLEEKIGMGQIEEVIEQAQYELETARLLCEYKVWEPLVEKPLEVQWRWPIH